MVDISKKKITTRVAKAEGYIYMNRATLEMIEKGLHKKGDVLSIARLAGIMGAKKTSDLIPLCHPLSIEGINIDFQINNKSNSIKVLVDCKTTNKTGIEIEALTAVSICTLTIYDMCKSVDRGMIIDKISLIHKSGGKSGTFNKKKVLLGVNNRNLKNMAVDINHALNVVKKNNKNYIICESGIKSFEQYQNLISQGF